MSGCTPHVLNVVGADTFLWRSGTGEFRLTLPQEDGLKRQHSSDREQHRWIFRNQWSAGQDMMPPSCIEVEKCLSNLSAAKRSKHGRVTEIGLYLLMLRTLIGQLYKTQQKTVATRLTQDKALARQKQTNKTHQTRTIPRGIKASMIEAIDTQDVSN